MLFAQMVNEIAWNTESHLNATAQCEKPSNILGNITPLGGRNFFFFSLRQPKYSNLHAHSANTFLPLLAAHL